MEPLGNVVEFIGRYESSNNVSLVESPNGSSTYSQNLSLSAKFKCPYSVCIYSTSHKSNLNRHILSMHLSSKNRMICCKEKFYSRRQYGIHMKTVHSKGFRCELCYQYFVRNNILTRHIDAKHNTNRHAHQCSHCQYSTSHKSNLDRHVSVKHKIWRPVPELFDADYTVEVKCEATAESAFPSPSSFEGTNEYSLYLPKKLRVSKRYRNWQIV